MSIPDDVLKMIVALQADRKYGPYEMHLPDEYIISKGGNPNNYPELEGHPGWRVVRANEDKK